MRLIQYRVASFAHASFLASLLLIMTGCAVNNTTLPKLPNTVATLPDIDEMEVEPSIGLRSKETRTWDGVRYMPVKGITQRQIANNFGAPRDGGKRSHKGIDVFAPSGRELLAMTSGWIERTYNNLGGHSVWLRGDDGINYYYAHLLRYASNAPDGDRVVGGEVIGYVGNSGNAKNTPAHLHIEMRRGGTSLNPYHTLSSPDLVVTPMGASTPNDPQYAEREPTKTPVRKTAARTAPARNTPGENARTSGGSAKSGSKIAAKSGASKSAASKRSAPAKSAKLTKKQKAAKLAAAKKAAKNKKLAAKKSSGKKKQIAKKGRKGGRKYASR